MRSTVRPHACARARVCVCRGNAILKRKACMGPGVGAQRRGPVPKRMSHECVCVCPCGYVFRFFVCAFLCVHARVHLWVCV